MIVPYGLSVGDFIAAVGLTRDVVSSLRGRGGAIDAFRKLLNELDVDCQTVEQLQATSLPLQYADDEAAIARQANSLHSSALRLFDVVGECERAFR